MIVVMIPVVMLAIGCIVIHHHRRRHNPGSLAGLADHPHHDFCHYFCLSL